MKKVYFLLLTLSLPLTSFASYTPPINLGVGSTGPEVVELQSFLEESGYLVIPTGIKKGYFGPLTNAAFTKYKLAAFATTTPTVVDSTVACPIGYICTPVTALPRVVPILTPTPGPIPTPFIVVPQTIFYTTGN